MKPLRLVAQRGGLSVRLVRLRAGRGGTAASDWLSGGGGSGALASAHGAGTLARAATDCVATLVGAAFEIPAGGQRLGAHAPALLLGSVTPLWMVALWAAFATTLNVSLRALRPHYLLAAVLAAMGAPLAYYAGARLGALQWVKTIVGPAADRPWLGGTDAAADEVRAALRRVRPGMNALLPWLGALPWMLATALLAWVIATRRRNVGLVDIFWSLFILVAALLLLPAQQPVHTARALLVLALATHVGTAARGATWHCATGMHRRITATRPFARATSPASPGRACTWCSACRPCWHWWWLHRCMPRSPPCNHCNCSMSSGAVLVLAGTVIESVADAQLAAFRADAANRGRVMDSGLWRYSRHPNYFGEFCVWWGFFLIALATGAWWTLVSPLLMSVLLLRVSGVTLLEQDIGARRPGYAAYVARTNAFFPGPRKPIPGKGDMSRLTRLAAALLVRRWQPWPPARAPVNHRCPRSPRSTCRASWATGT